MLPKAERLTTREVAALSKGKSVFGTLLSLRVMPSPIDRSKFAVAVSKKVAPRAVDRNVIRRKSYGALSVARKDLNYPVFAMIIPKRECLLASADAILADIHSVFGKAGAA